MCSLYEVLYLTNSIATLFHPPWGPGFKVHYGSLESYFQVMSLDIMEGF